MPGSNNPTIVNGLKDGTKCEQYRAWLAAHIYTPPDRPTLASRLSIINEEWEVVKEIDENSGLRARAYWPKSKEKGACFPAIVFRGSREESTEGLAFFASVSVEGSSYNNILLQAVLYSRHDGKYEIKFGGTDDLYEELRKNYKPIMADDKSSVGFKVSDKIFLRLRIRGGLYGSKEGDWNNNLQQARGLESDMYENAIKFGRAFFSDFVERREKRMDPCLLWSVGHSLGGGLASAVSCVLGKDHATEYIRTQTFNAAGLHENTVKRHDASKSHANAQNFTVQNEILTTIQSHTNELLFIGPILKLLNTVPPRSLGTPSDSPAFDLSGNGHGRILPIDPSKCPHAIKLHNFLQAPSVDGVEILLLSAFAEYGWKVLTAEPRPTPGTVIDMQTADQDDMFGYNYSVDVTRNTVTSKVFIPSEEDADSRNSFEIAFDKMKAEIIREIDTVKESFGKTIERHLMEWVIPSYEHKNGMRGP